jgi:RNA polymerase sigma-70 factor (ECF subfamily)
MLLSRPHMNSEATAYLPDALAHATDTREPEYSRERPSAASPEIEALEAASHAPPSHVDLLDEALLLKVGQGDRDALSTLFRRYARTVRNVAYRILRNEQEAEDLTQDIFVFIAHKATQFRPELGRAGSWIVQVAYHRAFDRRRSLKSRHFYSSLDLDDVGVTALAASHGYPLFEESLQGSLGNAFVRKYEEHLTADQRRIIELFFFEGHSLKEIAEITGHSPVNVRHHYYRGLDRLRRYVVPENIRPK